MKADNLKAGNPELTDEQVQFGIRRAAEIFATHDKVRPIKSQPRRPGTLQLTDYQLAAIVAGAYCDGAEAYRAGRASYAPLVAAVESTIEFIEAALFDGSHDENARHYVARLRGAL